MSLYNLPALKNEEALIDLYLASLMRRDPERYSLTVELQMRRAEDSHRVIARWLKIPELFPPASKKDFSDRSADYVANMKEPLIDNKLITFLHLSDANRYRDRLAVEDYLQHGNDPIQMLSTYAPEVIAHVHPASPPAGNENNGRDLPPVEASSSNAAYFMSDADLSIALGEMNSLGAKTLVFELAGKNEAVLSRVTQHLIHKKDVPELIHLFNHLPSEKQKVLVSEMVESGLLPNGALYHEKVTGKSPEDAVWAEFFRDFFKAALPYVADPHSRDSLRDALLQTYSTEMELAQASFAGREEKDFEDQAKFYLRHRIAYNLLLEHAESLGKKADNAPLRRQKQDIEAARADFDE